MGYNLDNTREKQKHVGCKYKPRAFVANAKTAELIPMNIIPLF
jgi:hypothetical protein